MTYVGVLALFLIPPTVALAVLVVRQRGASSWLPYIAVLSLAAIAVLYTTPWDNYLVVTSVWWYDENLVTGVTLGWVPIEEYLFFILQTLLTGFWTVLLLGAAKPVEPAYARWSVRLRAAIGAGLLWLLALVVGASGWAPATYLWLILAWGLIPLMLQLAYGADILFAHRRLLLGAIAVPTVYLWFVDFVAIRWGTWTLDPYQTLGLALGGTLVVEEMVFFLATNVLVAFGMILILAGTSQQRARAILAQIRGAMRGDS